MVARVLFGDFPDGGKGLRVSMPGQNVLFAGPGQLQFSSDFAQLSPFPYVDMDCNWNEGAPRFFPFPKSFPSVPMIHFQQVISADEMKELGTSFMSWGWEYKWTDLNGNQQTARHQVSAQPTTTGLQVWSENGSTRPSQITPPDFRMRYTLMDYNL